MELLVGENANQLLSRIILEYRTTKKSVVVYEFPVKSSYDNNGNAIDNNCITFTSSELMALVAGNVKEIAYSLCRLEDKLGCPIVVPSISRKDVKRRSAETITDRLNKFTRRMKYESKNVSNINPEITDSQNIDTKTSLETLIAIASLDETQIYENYLGVLAMSQRDELFYKRRHPDAVMLHRVCDPEIVAMKREYEWAMGVDV